MKKIISILCLLAIMSASVSAYNYTFSSGADTETTFAKSTQSEAFTIVNPYENVRNNKDSAYSPPQYGIFSGEIPTEILSLYHTPDKPSAVNSAPAITYANYPESENGAVMPILSELSQVSGGDILPSASVYSGENAKITPLYYDDNSIGTLEFPQFNRVIKVYEGETAENMKIGAGHFTGTSAWDGNVAVCAHNRGVENNFGFLKNMNIGDKIKYVTKYGERIYEVTGKKTAAVDDVSALQWSNENLLTLATCVENDSSIRLIVTAKAVSDN
jgi:sortase A